MDQVINQPDEIKKLPEMPVEEKKEENLDQVE